MVHRTYMVLEGRKKEHEGFYLKLEYLGICVIFMTQIFLCICIKIKDWEVLGEYCPIDYFHFDVSPSASYTETQLSTRDLTLSI